jgi:hypothetical protein
MKQENTIPPGFTAQSWQEAIDSGQLIVVETRQQTRVPVAIRAPFQLLRWTIRARLHGRPAPRVTHRATR